MYYVYILKSLKDKGLYTGFTNRLNHRLAKHKAGKVFSTKHRLPVKLIYYEAYLFEEDARRREKYFKTGWGRAYIKKILSRALS